MITGKNSESPNEVHGLTEEQRRDIMMYLQGMVYGWCESQSEKESEGKAKSQPFAARNLVGGVNWHWKGTPLQCVYDKQTTDEKTAYDVAAQEVGRLLKRIIIDDQRGFTCEKDGLNTYHYTWDGKYPPKE